MNKVEVFEAFSKWQALEEDLCDAASSYIPDKSGACGVQINIDRITSNGVDFTAVYDMYDWEDKKYFEFTFKQLGIENA